MATITSPAWATSGLRLSATASPVGGCGACRLAASHEVFVAPATPDAVRHVGDAPDGTVMLASDVLKSLVAPWALAEARRPSVVHVHSTLFVAHEASVFVPAGTMLVFTPSAGVVVEGSLHLAGTRAAPVVLRASSSSEQWAGVRVLGHRARARMDHTFVHGTGTSGSLIALSDHAKGSLGTLWATGLLRCPGLALLCLTLAAHVAARRRRCGAMYPARRRDGQQGADGCCSRVCCQLGGS